MIVFFVFGAIFIVQGTYGDDYVRDRCDKIKKDGSLSGIDGPVFESATVLDKSLIEATNYMCTTRCPCLYKKEAFEKYLAIEESVYNGYDRTKTGMCVDTEAAIRSRYETKVAKE